MIRIIISLFVCVFLSAIIKWLFPYITPSKEIIQNIYAILGIMFSIGMSLAITFNLSGIKNLKIKRRIRDNVNRVRNNFIIYFAIVSLFYIIEDILNTTKKTEFCIYEICFVKYSHIMILLMLYVIAYYIFNFLEMQKLNTQIEEELDKN
ncbi:hypothetical protein OKE68_10600 [Riemerella anatipestifer]|uniref:Uncharacterized protein n=1 Tax=Riemerella anatipestifer TaxID=34085 RepID=A0AAP3AMX4_RIEAN|nr:hypothetical protein [Riemerella anatipestifer]MCU7569221.1 hypothetical protein [Riemerella anatipestifer]MCW0491188.1 hypothetical protein [Riemerella anatipestifer]MCW0524761.1 hypothetical protein [Riemerella anatipestifer]MDD1539262.1 hypothetical protein [Riemerella anatipestifer]MDR7797757.1 hypothetical protein [Riemerella anatipestifer]